MTRRNIELFGIAVLLLHSHLKVEKSCIQIRILFTLHPQEQKSWPVLVALFMTANVAFWDTKCHKHGSWSIKLRTVLPPLGRLPPPEVR